MKKYLLLSTMIFVTVIVIISFIGCDLSPGGTPPGSDIGDCEVVINAGGPSFLKVINISGSYIEVYLPEYAFAAIVRPNVCEIYGVNSGSRDLEISRCSDGDCNSLSSTINSDFYVESGETFTIEVTDGFF